MQTPYEALVAALKATGIPFAEDGWGVAPRGQAYGVVAIEMQFDSAWADGRMQEQGVEGSVDLFTPTVGIAEARQVQSALDSVEGVSWRFNSRQFEDDTRLAHWEWIWRVVGL